MHKIKQHIIGTILLNSLHKMHPLSPVENKA